MYSRRNFVVSLQPLSRIFCLIYRSGLHGSEQLPKQRPRTSSSLSSRDLRLRQGRPLRSQLRLLGGIRRVVVIVTCVGLFRFPASSAKHRHRRRFVRRPKNGRSSTVVVRLPHWSTGSPTAADSASLSRRDRRWPSHLAFAGGRRRSRRRHRVARRWLNSDVIGVRAPTVGTTLSPYDT
jgi:hypothetical protein